MTEEEAKKKICPILRKNLLMNAKNGLLYEQDGISFCLASACMMWRWDDDGMEYVFSNPDDDSWKHDPYHSSSAYVLQDRWSRMREKREGYCGLGGHP